MATFPISALAADRVDNSLQLFAGGAAGYGNVSGSEYSRAADGPQASLGADIAFEPPHFAVDAGVGWMVSRLDGELANSNPISIRTRNGFLETSVRYRIGEHWQIGPAYQLAFGTDTGFGPSVTSPTTTSLLGPRAVYETALFRFPFRVIGQTLAAVGDGGRGFILATLGFQFGLQIKAAEAAPEVRTAEIPIHESQAGTVHITLDERKVFFATNSARIRPAVESALRDIGAYLAAHNDGWSELSVNGHADQRGRANYNLELSRRRADSVASALSATGVNKGKIDVEAFGFFDPADPHNTPTAWSRNRRVELFFEGVKDPAALKAHFDQLSHFELEEKS